MWHLLFPEGTHNADFTHNDVGEWLDAYTEEVEQYTKRLAAAPPSAKAEEIAEQVASARYKLSPTASHKEIVAAIAEILRPYIPEGPPRRMRCPECNSGKLFIDWDKGTMGCNLCFYTDDANKFFAGPSTPSPAPGKCCDNGNFGEVHECQKGVMPTETDKTSGRVHRPSGSATSASSKTSGLAGEATEGPEKTVNMDCPKCSAPIGWNPHRGWFHMQDSNCSGVRDIPWPAPAAPEGAAPPKHTHVNLWYETVRGELMQLIPALTEGGDVQKLAMAELRCAEKMLAALPDSGAVTEVRELRAKLDEANTIAGNGLDEIRRLVAALKTARDLASLAERCWIPETDEVKEELKRLLAALAPEPSETKSMVGAIVRVDNPQFTGYGFAEYDTGDRKRCIGVKLENGHTWEYAIETVRLAWQHELPKVPKAVLKLANVPSETKDGQ